MKWPFGLFKAKPSPNIWVTEEALADNNCVFNAWTLGLTQQHVLDQIETFLRRQKKSPHKTFRQFIARASRVLNVSATWHAVKAKMLTLRKRDSELLQEILAPVMRALAIDVMQVDFECKNTQSEYYLNLQAIFEPEWQAYVLAMFNSDAESGDDIFMRHAFIGRYFAKLCESLPDEMSEEEIVDYISTQQQTVMQWWRTHGYVRFLQEMREDGEWGGDFELKALAQYFHVNLVQENEAGYRSTLYRDYGSLSVTTNKRGLKVSDLRQLASRGVIDSFIPDAASVVTLRLCDEAAIELALGAVPQFKQVQQFIEMNRDALYGVPFNLRGEFSSACLQALTARSVLVFRQGQYYFNLSDASEALTRVNVIDNAEQIKYHVKKSLNKLPQVTLQHVLVDGCFAHWNHCRPFATMVEALRFRIQELNKTQTTKWKDLIAAVEASSIARQRDRAALCGQVTSELIGKSDTHNIASIQRAVHAALYANFPEYQIASSKKVIVSKQEQIKLDELLAVKLQKEEIARYERFVRK